MSALDQLTFELAKLPGIGEKTAVRLALFILRQPSGYAHSLASALKEVVEKTIFCSTCHHITDTDPCRICANSKRDPSTICVVEESSDLMAIEKSNGYRGHYHVLQGALSPIDGIGPNDLTFRQLIERIKTANAKEIILATNPNVNGDATALYTSKLIKPIGVRITKLASGLPIGGHIEYIDQMTLARSIESRVEY